MITFNRAPSSISTLAGLTISRGSLSPEFSSGVTSYTVQVLYQVTSITVTPVTSDPPSTLLVNNVALTSGATSSAYSLTVGSSNVITVRVNAQNGVAFTTYTITVQRLAASTVSSLISLSTSVGTLSPAFSPSQLQYYVALSNSVTSITVSASVTDTNSTMTVNGTSLLSGATSSAYSLNVRNTTFFVNVRAEDGTTVTSYRLVVFRAPSAVSTLSALETSYSQDPDPAFSELTLAYTLSVPNSQASISIFASTVHPMASVTVNNTAIQSGTFSSLFSLRAGANNLFVVRVTAEDGVTITTYTVTVYRDPCMY